MIQALHPLTIISIFWQNFNPLKNRMSQFKEEENGKFT